MSILRENKIELEICINANKLIYNKNILFVPYMTIFWSEGGEGGFRNVRAQKRTTPLP